MYLFTQMLLLLLISWPVVDKPEKENVDDLCYEFSQVNNGYTFRGSFFVKADPTCLIHIFYDFHHLVNFVTNADSIVLLREGDIWYEVCYTYRKFLFESRSIYRKTLKQEEQRVTFEMITSEQRGVFLPKVLSSTGYYELKSEKEGYKAVYFQECKIESNFLKGIYLHMAKKEAIRFLRELKMYVERTCY